MPSSAKRSRRRFLVFTGLAFILLASCSSRRRDRVVSAPTFELKDLSGNTVSLESFRGHPILLDFWATWCGPCRVSIPMVEDFYARHKNEGLVVLGMNMDDDPSPVYAFVKKMKITYPVLLAANTSVPSDYEIDGIPNFVFIDPDLHVKRIYQGFAPEVAEAWEEDLKDTLKKNQ